MRPPGDFEDRVADDGHRLVPGHSHDAAEVRRHVARYDFCRRLIASDLGRRQAAGAPAPVRILDLGCGTGYGSRILSDLPGATVSACDSSPEAVEYARGHYSAGNISFEVRDAAGCTRPGDGTAWDYVVSNEVVEHIPDGMDIVRRLVFTRIAIISTPYREPAGVNRHHVICDIGEETYDFLPRKVFFYTDLEGSITTRSLRPGRPVNLVAAIPSDDAAATVEAFRRIVCIQTALRIAGRAPGKGWSAFRRLAHPLTAFSRGLLRRGGRRGGEG